MGARIVLAGMLASLTGCASIISGRHVDIPINSTPSGANVSVRNSDGELVAQAVTPARVSLKRGRGVLRRPPKYIATIDKPGYETQSVQLNPSVNPWIAGNLVLGGVIGLAADSATGAMWRFSPGEVNYVLDPQATASTAPQAAGPVMQTDYEGAAQPQHSE